MQPDGQYVDLFLFFFVYPSKREFFWSQTKQNCLSIDPDIGAYGAQAIALRSTFLTTLILAHPVFIHIGLCLSVIMEFIIYTSKSLSEIRIVHNRAARFASETTMWIKKRPTSYLLRDDDEKSEQKSTKGELLPSRQTQTHLHDA